jgi:hypothetical protein
MSTPQIYCRCGKLLKIKVRREGVVLQCPEHGVVLRYVVGKEPPPKPDKER